jgi:hypothetical protein
MQRDDVRDHQQQQHQRQAMTCSAKKRFSVASEITKSPRIQVDQFGSPIEGDGREQVDDDLGAPVGHLPPRQQIAHEGLGHQHQVDQACRRSR